MKKHEGKTSPGSIPRNVLLPAACTLLMIVVLLAADWLSRGRSMAVQDTIFLAFLVIEALLAGLLTWIVVKHMPAEAEGSKAWAALLLSGFIAFWLNMAGILLSKWLAPAQAAAGWYVIAVTLPLLVLLYGGSLLGNHLYGKHLSAMQEADRQAYLLSRLEEAQDSMAQAYRRVRLLRRLVDGYFLLVLAAASLTAFASGVVGGNMWVLIAAFFFLHGVVSRLPFPQPPESPDAPSLKETSYPALYGLARAAAKAIGVQGDLQLVLTNDCNAGIRKEDSGCLVDVGVILLGLYTQEELYQVLLHEFAHMTASVNPAEREYRLYQRIQCPSAGMLSNITGRSLSFAYTLYSFHFLIYSHVVSTQVELLADQAVITHGDPEIAASALVKLQYFDLFNWELRQHLPESYYAPEEQPTASLSRLLDAFCRVMPERKAFWDQLIAAEIQPRSATHPITRNRLERLGVKDYTAVLPQEENDYRSECRRALKRQEKVVYKAGRETYAQEREEQYLQPLRLIKEWEAAGRPVEAAKYAEVVDALCQVRREEEAVALCDGVIACLSGRAAAYAWYGRGIMRLHRYDQRGIADIYQAIDADLGFAEEGADAIGGFCCMMGLEKELEEYRQKAPELMQKKREEYDPAHTLVEGDTLAQEHLPPELRGGLIACLREAGGEVIEEVFCVRKVISGDTFASAVIVRFQQETEDKDKAAVLRKIDHFLNACPDWPFSLFDYEAVPVSLDHIPSCCLYRRPAG